MALGFALKNTNEECVSENMYTHKKDVRVGEESVKKKLVIQWFRKLNITELLVRGNKEKEGKRHGRYTLRSQAGASETGY